MTDVVVKMRDGTTKEFRHRPRPGGSYDIMVKYEGAFLVVIDEYGDQTAIPAEVISDVKITGRGY